MPLNVGVVGYNSIGQRHAECHHEDDLATLVAVCDVVQERAEPAREQYGAAIHGSVRDMLAAHPELDVVDVCTGGDENGGWHFEPAMQALDAGKHVLVEKPLSNDLEEARQMVEFAAGRGLYLGCNLNHHFSEPGEKAMELVRDGKIGEQLYCLMRMGFQGGEYTYSGPGGGANSRGFPYFHVKAFLSHPFAIMRHFCGDITHVQAFMNRPGFRRAAGDLMVSLNSIHVRFASDAVGYLFSQRGDARMGYGGWWSFELGGTRGTFAIENCVEKLIHYPAPGAEGAADPAAIDLGSAPEPTVLNTAPTSAPPSRAASTPSSRTSAACRCGLRARRPGHPGVHLRSSLGGEPAVVAGRPPRFRGNRERGANAGTIGQASPPKADSPIPRRRHCDPESSRAPSREASPSKSSPWILRGRRAAPKSNCRLARGTSPQKPALSPARICASGALGTRRNALRRRSTANRRPRRLLDEASPEPPPAGKEFRNRRCSGSASVLQSSLAQSWTLDSPPEPPL